MDRTRARKRAIKFRYSHFDPDPSGRRDSPPRTTSTSSGGQDPPPDPPQDGPPQATKKRNLSSASSSSQSSLAVLQPAPKRQRATTAQARLRSRLGDDEPRRNQSPRARLGDTRPPPSQTRAEPQGSAQRDSTASRGQQAEDRRKDHEQEETIPRLAPEDTPLVTEDPPAVIVPPPTPSQMDQGQESDLTPSEDPAGSVRSDDTDFTLQVHNDEKL